MNTYSCAFNCVKCFVIFKNKFLHYYHPFFKSHVAPYLDASHINIPCLECLKHNIEGDYYDDENRPFHVTKSVFNDKLTTKTYYFLSDVKQQKIVPCDYEFLNITINTVILQIICYQSSLCSSFSQSFSSSNIDQFSIVIL